MQGDCRTKTVVSGRKLRWSFGKTLCFCLLSLPSLSQGVPHLSPSGFSRSCASLPNSPVSAASPCSQFPSAFSSRASSLGAPLRLQSPFAILSDSSVLRASSLSGDARPLGYLRYLFVAQTLYQRCRSSSRMESSSRAKAPGASALLSNSKTALRSSMPASSFTMEDEECVAAGILPVCRVGNRVLALFYNATGGKKKNFLVDFGGCKERSARSPPPPSTPSLSPPASPVLPACSSSLPSSSLPHCASRVSPPSAAPLSSAPGEDQARVEARKKRETKRATKQGDEWEADGECAAREVWEETDQLWGLVAGYFLQAEPPLRKRRRADADKSGEDGGHENCVTRVTGKKAGGNHGQTNGKKEKKRLPKRRETEEGSDEEVEERRQRWKAEICSWLMSIPTLATFSRSKYRCYIKEFPAFFPLLFMNLRGEEGEGWTRNRRFLWVDVDAFVTSEEGQNSESLAAPGERVQNGEAKQAKAPPNLGEGQVATPSKTRGSESEDKREEEGRVPIDGSEETQNKPPEAISRIHSKHRVVPPTPNSVPPLHYRLRHPRLGAILQDVKRKLLTENGGEAHEGKGFSSSRGSRSSPLPHRSSSHPASPAFSACTSAPPSASPGSASSSPFVSSSSLSDSVSGSVSSGALRLGRPLLPLLLPSRSHVLESREQVEEYLLSHVFDLLSRCRILSEQDGKGGLDGAGRDGGRTEMPNEKAGETGKNDRDKQQADAFGERSEGRGVEGLSPKEEREGTGKRRHSPPDFHGAPKALRRLMESEEWRQASVIWLDPCLPGKEALLDGSLLDVMREEELANQTFLTLPSFWADADTREAERKEQREEERRETEEREKREREAKAGGATMTQSRLDDKVVLLKARVAARSEFRKLLVVEEKPLKDLQSFQVDIAVVGCGAVTPDGLLLGRSRAAEPRSPAAVWTVAHDLQVLEGFLPLSSTLAQQRSISHRVGDACRAAGRAGCREEGEEEARGKQTEGTGEPEDAEKIPKANGLGDNEEKGSKPEQGQDKTVNARQSTCQQDKKGEDRVSPLSDCSLDKAPQGSGDIASFLASAVEEINRELESSKAFSELWGSKPGVTANAQHDKDAHRRLEIADKVATPSRCWNPQKIE
ncbi:hypothetical protein TGRUB_224830 [Toxoplasma gondii RUB]|uniref:Transmembrane protein n=1 Tax=Toxoplasma gondii RUB TaxID=935652 RepID=A0A086LVQ7_TOXGO|nr:hypothetical protein TGRUB_224830 [Toxoplasma gondii RUB]